MSVHVPVDDLGHIGAPLGSAESSAAPNAAGHQLERPGRDFLPGARHPDDDRFPPSLVASLERYPHDLGVADTFKRIVGAAARQIDKVSDKVSRDLRGIDEVSHPKLAAPVLLRLIDVNADDHIGADEFQSLNDIEADATEPEHDAVGSGFHLRRVDYRAKPGGNAATDIAHLAEGSIGADLRHGDLG